MKLLLDTHVWIWSHVEPERIGGAVRRALASATNELWLSPISIWELGLLCDSGQIKLSVASVGEWITRAFEQRPLLDAMLTREVAIEARAVKLAHRDPADRLLAATARVHDLTLVTADARLLAGTGFRTTPNR